MYLFNRTRFNAQESSYYKWYVSISATAQIVRGMKFIYFFIINMNLKKANFLIFFFQKIKINFFYYILNVKKLMYLNSIRPLLHFLFPFNKTSPFFLYYFVIRFYMIICKICINNCAVALSILNRKNVLKLNIH